MDNRKQLNAIDFSNDDLLVKLNLRIPSLIIDRSVFKKTQKEKEELKIIKSVQGKISTLQGLIVSREEAVLFKNKAKNRSYGTHSYI